MGKYHESFLKGANLPTESTDNAWEGDDAWKNDSTSELFAMTDLIDLIRQRTVLTATNTMNTKRILKLILTDSLTALKEKFLKTKNTMFQKELKVFLKLNFLI